MGVGITFGGLCPCGRGSTGHQPCALIAPVAFTDSEGRAYYVSQGPPAPVPKPPVWPELRKMFREHWEQTGGQVCCDTPRTLRLYRSWCLRSFLAGLATNDPKWRLYL